MAEKLYAIDAATILFPLGEQCVIQRLGNPEVVTLEDGSAARAFIDCFTPPASLAAARARAAPIGTALFDRLVPAALHIGVLREHEGDVPGAAPDPAQARAMLVAIAHVAEELAGDVAAMGPSAYRYAGGKPEEELQGRLRRALGELTALATALGARRKQYVAEQRARLSGKAPRLHLGCGRNSLPGWYNIDLFPAELALELRWGLPFAEGSIELVYLAHLFEHLYKKTDAPRLLREICRVLAPGGIVRIIVPDAEAYMRAYVERDEKFFAMQRRVWPAWAPQARTHLEAILGYLGAAESPKNFAQHKYGYDFVTLGLLLEEAGFRDVVRSSYMASEHAALRVDDSSSVAEAQVDGRYASLFVEARK